MQVAVAQCDDMDVHRLVAFLVERTDVQLAGAQPKGALLFASIDTDHPALLRGLRAHYPELPIIGCTTDGEISSFASFQEDSCVLAVFFGDDVDITTGLGKSVSKDALGAARAAAERANRRTGKPQLLLVTPESMTTSAGSLLAALQSEYGEDFPIFGGLAADQWRFQSTYQFHDGECHQDAMPIMVFWGDVPFSLGVASGWSPMGERRLVTQSQQNVVAQIGDQRATDFYAYYFGDGSDPLGEYPLAVYEDETRYTLRAPLQCDTDAGTITFAGDVATGAQVQLAQATRDSILAAARASVEQALRAYQDCRPAFAFCISCAARKQLLGTRAVEELELVSKALASKVPIVGFYAYGEICPLELGEPTRFHNETFVTLLLGRQSEP